MSTKEYIDEHVHGLVVLQGLVTLAFGVIALFFPGLTLANLVTLFAVYVAVVGVAGDGLDLGRGDHGGERQPGAEGLRQREDVRHEALGLERVPVAGAAQAGLRLVDDDEHAALAALGGQCGEIAGRGDDDAAGREDRLDDAGGERADGLRVDQVERVVELAAPVQLPVRPDDVRVVGVRRGDGDVARRRRPVPADDAEPETTAAETAAADTLAADTAALLTPPETVSEPAPEPLALTDAPVKESDLR